MKEIKIAIVKKESVIDEKEIMEKVRELINYGDYDVIINKIKECAISFGSIVKDIESKEKDIIKVYNKKCNNPKLKELSMYQSCFISVLDEKICEYRVQILKFISLLRMLEKSDDIMNFDSIWYIKCIYEIIEEYYVMYVYKKLCYLNGIEPSAYCITSIMEFDNRKEANIFKKAIKTTNRIISEFENGAFGDGEYKEFYDEFFKYLGSARLGSSFIGIETTTIFDAIKWHNYYNKK